MPNLLIPQQPSIPIQGIYVQSGTPIAIQVERLPEGGYIFRMVLIRSTGKIIPIEAQSAYVEDLNDSNIVFYWHTGRYEGIPESNTIITYRLTYDGIGKLSGTYFFPEKPATLAVPITFVRKR